MRSYKEIDNDLIELAIAGSFDVIAHGCNCFCMQGAGIAAQMRSSFDTTNPYYYPSENVLDKRGEFNKLGNIEYSQKYVGKGGNNTLIVVNAYTQYQPGANLDYEALTLCLRKINHEFKGKHIGLPQIGAGIAGGDWKKIKTIIQQELKDCDVTVVIYNK